MGKEHRPAGREISRRKEERNGDKKAQKITKFISDFLSFCAFLRLFSLRGLFDRLCDTIHRPIEEFRSECVK